MANATPINFPPPLNTDIIDARSVKFRIGGNGLPEIIPGTLKASMPWLIWFSQQFEALRSASGGGGGTAPGNGLGATPDPTTRFPAQILVTTQANLAVLYLSTVYSNYPVFVYITDFYHLMYWSGTALDFADDGSNYYTYSDHAPPSPSGWVACAGQSVTYLLHDGTTASKTLPDIYDNPGFLLLGSGAGTYQGAVAPTINSSASLSGFGLSGTGTYNGIIQGSSTSPLTYVGGFVTFGSSNIALSGSSTISSGVGILGSIQFSIGTLFTAGTVGSGSLGVGGSASVGTSISGSGSVGTALSGTGAWNANDYTSNAFVGGTVFDASFGLSASYSVSSGVDAFVVDDSDAADASVNFGSWGGGVSYSGSSTINVSPGSMSLSSGAVSSSYSLSSGSVNLSSTTITGSPTFTTSLSMNPHDLDTYVLNTLATPSLTVPSFGLYVNPTNLDSSINLSALYVPSMTIPASGLTLSTNSVGLSSVTLTGSGTLTATAGTNGTPNAWLMQAWFRI